MFLLQKIKSLILPANFAFGRTANVCPRYPVTPENYTVWYEYFAGTNLDLNRAIDGFLANSVSFY